MNGSLLFSKRVIWGLCVLPFLIAGCGGGGGGGAVGARVAVPVITKAAAIMPSGLSRHGGNVTIRVTVISETDVSSVVATVTGPAAAVRIPQLVTLTPTLLTTYYGVFNAPAVSTGQAETYTIVVNATDAAGHAAAPKTVVFVIPDVPPPPPI